MKKLLKSFVRSNILFKSLFFFSLQNHLEEGSTKSQLKIAVDTVTDVATAINEFKRRKDLGKCLMRSYGYSVCLSSKDFHSHF